MKQYQYSIWVRWKNGAQDKFAITHWEHARIRVRGLHNDKLDCEDGSYVWLNRDDLVCFKLFCKEVPVNPLSASEHYDNPTN